MTRAATHAGTLAYCLCLLFAGLAHAGIATYTSQAMATGTLGSSSFNNALVNLTFIGETTNVTHFGSIYVNVVGTATVSVSGIGTASLITHTFAVSVDQTAGKISMGDLTLDGSIFPTYNASFNSYDLTTAVAPTSGWGFIRDDLTFPTTLGGLHFTGMTGNTTFSVTIVGHPAFFAGEVPLANGVYYLQFTNGKPFGYYSYLPGGFIFHFDMGYEYVFSDPADPQHPAYLWDYKAAHWLYTSPGLFPYMYDFTLNSWIYYFPDSNNPGHYSTNPRWFANMATSQVFTM